MFLSKAIFIVVVLVNINYNESVESMWQQSRAPASSECMKVIATHNVFCRKLWVYMVWTEGTVIWATSCITQANQWKAAIMSIFTSEPLPSISLPWKLFCWEKIIYLNTLSYFLTRWTFCYNSILNKQTIALSKRHGHHAY